MTVSTNINKATFNGSGSTGPFTFNFRFYMNTEISVLLVASDGTDTLLVEGTDYTLTGAGSYGGGLVTLTTALAVGTQLVIMRLVDLLQSTEIRNLGTFFPEIHEDVFDRMVMMIQQISEMAERAIKLPSSQSGNFELPAQALPNTLVGFDINGNLALKTASYTISVNGGAGIAPTVTYVDASVGSVIANLPSSGEVIIIKTDATANPVTVTGTGGNTVLRQASIDLSVQDESIHLIMNGSNWYRI